MTYDLILCECVCGHRTGHPCPSDEDIAGFVCDACGLRFRFEEDLAPVRVELTDPGGVEYPLGFRVFSAERDSRLLAEEIVQNWFKPRRRTRNAA